MLTLRLFSSSARLARSSALRRRSSASLLTEATASR